MRNNLLRCFVLFVFLLSLKNADACHGLTLVNYSYSIGATGITINGSSNSATCGCGPYWMQAEVACTAAGVSGNPPAAVQNTLGSWTGPGTTYNSYPWYNSLLNVAGYSSPNWTDQCVVEPYNSIFISFAGLCPGQTYYFAAREWLSGSNTGGPWSAVTSFTVPGVLTPLTASVSASPTTVCAGQCATLTVSGITGGCGSGTTATWSHGLGTGLTKTVCPTVTTTYNVTVSTGCNSIIYPVTVTVVPNVSAAFIASANQCLTGNSFTFNHTGTAGVTGHTWSWGDGTANGTGNPATHSYTAAGTYVVSHTATLGSCQGVSTTTVTVYPMPNIPTLTPVHPTCGMNNGSITVAASGGNAPYSYSINGGGFQTGTTFSGLAAGTYTITVQTANGCQRTNTVTLVNQPGPTSVVLTSTVTGCGVSTGSIGIGAVTGGTAGYTYSLNNAAGPFTSTTSYTNLAAGTYTVYLQDANGCPYNQTVTVGTATGPTAFTFTTSPSGCTTSTGSISVTGVTGGTAAYQYSFNNGTTFGAATSATGLAAGTYTVIVKDANNCTFSQVITVGTQPGPTNITYNNTQPTCGMPNGIINATGVGGTPGYTYSLNGGASQGSGTFTGITAATYTLSITDANGCTFTNTTVVTNAGSPTVTVSNTVAVSCNGGSNGSATVTGSGGAPTYTFSIAPGGATSLSGVFTGLVAGTYTVTVTDANTCSNTTSFTITEPTVLTNTISATANVSCNGGNDGSITASGGGGSPGYNYSINGGAFQASGTFSGLTQGSYTVTVQDAGGCQATAITSLTQPAALLLTMSSTNANCTSANGIATVSVSGGTPTYTYGWTGGGGSGSSTTGVVAGSYSVTVTDGAGCTATGSVTVGQTPGGVASITNVNNITCNGANDGSMTASITASSATTYTYSWAPAGGSAQTASNLAPGNYTVTVTDNFGCIATATASITQPAALTLNLGITNVSCNGGSDGTITATVNGGTPTYTYLWTPNVGTGNAVNGLPVGSYTCTVTDVNGCVATQSTTINQPTALSITYTVTNTTCNQANGAIAVTGSGGFPAYQFSINSGSFGSSTNFTNLAAATYVITIQDLNLCEASFPVSIVNTSGPSIALGTVTDVTCNGQCNGSAQVNVTGGTGTITYSWSNGQSTPIATNLCAGIYNVNATDANGCVATIGVTITEPTPLTTTVTVVDPSCFGGTDGTATASVLGGIQPYTFAWNSNPAQTTQTASGLSAGPISVIVTDSNNCTATGNGTLVNPAMLLASVTGIDPTCFGACNGSAYVTLTNGTAPFTYSWNDPNNQTTDSIAGLCVGSYTVDVVDDNGCTVSASVALTEPTAVVATVTATGAATCSGTCDGWAQASASGGSGIYSFSWSSGATGANANNLCVGQYTLTVTDHLNCVGTVPFVISEPNPLIVSVTGTDVKCFGICDGTGTTSFSGGTPPYTFLWQPSLDQVSNPTTLCAGTHTVVVTDSNGCNVQAVLTITEPNQLIASTTVSNSHCGQSDGSATVNFSGGTPPVNILWSNGVTTNTNAAILGGPHSVTLTDSNNCQVTTVANVNDITGPTVSIADSSDVTCFGLSDGSALGVVSGGTLPYSVVQWLPSNLTGLNPTTLPAGIQTFQVIDSAGCTASVNVTISQPANFVSAMSGVTHVTCFGLCDGSATMLVNGGTTINGSYNFQWTNGSTNAVQSNNLCAGSYSCTATDSLGCQTTATVTITQPQQLLINNTPGAQDVTCNGANNGSITVSVTGGTVPYAYVWSPNIGSGSVITGIGPGTDTLVVTDNKGCTQTAIYTINEPTAIALDSLVTTAVCGLANGSATVTATGGTPMAVSPFYSFVWNTSPAQTTATATNLAANNYVCTVTDANGCVATIPVVVGNIAGPTLSSITQTPVICFGQSNGSATFALSGGTNPINYTWINAGGTNQNQNNPVMSNVPAGTYAVTAVDSNGCIVSAQIAITQPNMLTLQASPQDTICFGQSTTVYAAAGGGTSPYTITWTYGTNTLSGPGPHTVNPTQTTTYAVNVVDSNGCVIPAVQTVVLVRPPLNSTTNNTAGCDQDTIPITALAGGGTGGPYTYTWTGVGTGQTQNVVVDFSQNPANYIVTISDGCSTPITDTVVVTAYALPFGQVIPSVLNGCVALDVDFVASTDIGTSFSWNYGDGSAADTGSVSSHMYTTDGVYDVTLTVVSAQGCTTIVSNPQMITVYPLPVSEFSWTPTDASVLNPLVSFVNASTGATTYSWDFGDLTTDDDVSALTDPAYAYGVTGNYTVTLIATSQYGCKDTINHVIIISPDFAIFVPNAFTPDGDGVNDTFFPKGVGIDEDKYKLIIYDRWGANIFETNKWSTGWDGKANGGTVEAQIDVYVWRIIVDDFKGEKHVLTGHVTVVK